MSTVQKAVRHPSRYLVVDIDGCTRSGCETVEAADHDARSNTDANGTSYIYELKEIWETVTTKVVNIIRMGDRQ